jgi:hypothetical protein
MQTKSRWTIIFIIVVFVLLLATTVGLRDVVRQPQDEGARAGTLSKSNLVPVAPNAAPIVPRHL